MAAPLLVVDAALSMKALLNTPAVEFRDAMAPPKAAVLFYMESEPKTI